MPEWTFVEYQHLASKDRSAFSMGPFGSKITKENYVPSGVPVVRGVNLARGIFIDDEFVFITDEKADDILSANLRPGDLIFTHRGTIGQVSMLPRRPRFERYVIGSSQVKTRLDESRALPEFYYYWFQSSEGQRSILANSSTVGVPGIATPLTSIRKLIVPLPSLEEQRAIADVLGALDEKIAVNDRIITGIEALLRAQFMAASQTSSEVRRIGEIVTLKYGKALTANDRTPGDVPIYGGNGVSGSHNIALVDGPGIVIGRKGANAGSISWSQCDFWPIDTAFYVVPKTEDLPLEFLFFLLERVDFRGVVGDSAIPGLNREIAMSLEVAVPEARSAHRFTELATPMVQLREQVARESRQLAQLRDALLQKLMSGEIKIQDAEVLA
ncbi:restriction endonuclease subunit S [Nonomuraea sp. NPDC050404]|uniref:restriction endonuclease subunit S n=1 Tax=Nonomuraea sp. NPDC050404 TaxID=3155783 RepID=UPI0033DA743E